MNTATGIKESAMINVGIVIGRSDYTAGLNYYYNLVFAAKQADVNNEFNFVFFLGNDFSSKQLAKFETLAKLVQLNIFDSNTLINKINKIENRIIGSCFLVNRIVKKYNIDVLSHSYFWGNGLNCKTINWIPDFQYLHLPHLWTKKQIENMEKYFTNLIRISDAVVVSSYDSEKDYQNFNNKNSDKCNVLQFVSQPNTELYSLDYNEEFNLKYGINEKFFYLPNQIWAHKNHDLVIDAVNQLKNQGVNIQVICTGVLSDFRDPKDTHLNYLLKKIKSLGLQENFKLLGLIDYEYVQYLMRYSLAVINASNFEGWSSTVEECKSIGKNMILSDINIHLEQAPNESEFFISNNVDSLCNVMSTVLSKYNGLPNYELENKAKFELTNRTTKFGSNYLRIIKSVLA